MAPRDIANRRLVNQHIASVVHMGMFVPTIVRSGRIVGTWKRTFRKNAVVLTANFFSLTIRIETRAVENAAVRYGHFLGMPVESHL